MDGEWIFSTLVGALALSGWVAYARERHRLRLESEARLRERADARRQEEHLRMKFEDCQSTNIVLSTKIIKMRGHRD